MVKTKRERVLEVIRKEKGNVSTITRADLEKVCRKYKLNFPQWITANAVSRGVYSLAGEVPAKAVVSAPRAGVTAQAINTPIPTMGIGESEVMSLPGQESVAGLMGSVSFVPEKFKGYVPFGYFNDVKKILASKIFYPMYIQGLSGNGKTLMIEQVCASIKREMIRANITIETDEDDLLGGFRLIDGKTVWQNGPVVIAMERGAVLLLDEVDLGSNKLMCLQPVLEGKPIFLKKINKVIHPADGFNIVATANTKGQGSDDGKFVGTNVLNEAFLERFSITLEQEYPPVKTEETILQHVLDNPDEKDLDFVTKLVRWADLIRKTYAQGGATEIVATRRLVHIITAYKIFNKNRSKSLSLCLNRFDKETQEQFSSLYSKIDAEVEKEKNPPAPMPEAPAAPAATAANPRQIPF